MGLHRDYRNLIIWTVKVAVGTGVAVALMLASAQDRSWDDVVRGVVAAIPGLIAGGIKTEGK